MTEFKLTTIDVSHLVDVPEFFLLARWGDIEELDIAAEEIAVAQSLDITVDPIGCYDRRDDAEAVAAVLRERHPSENIVVMSSNDFPT
jgi:hypothetical protein